MKKFIKPADYPHSKLVGRSRLLVNTDKINYIDTYKKSGVEYVIYFQLDRESCEWVYSCEDEADQVLYLLESDLNEER